METLLLPSNDINTLKISLELIQRGEVIAVPTETVYGLVCDWNNPKAIKQIYQLKGRDFNKPFTAFCNGIEMIKQLVNKVDENHSKIIKYFTPGPITLLMKRKQNVVDYSNTSTDIIGIRIPDNEFVLNLINNLNRPLASTSANISGNIPLSNAGELFKFFNGKIPLIVDGGNAKLGIASTVLDVTVSPPKIIREGSVNYEQIKKILE